VIRTDTTWRSQVAGRIAEVIAAGRLLGLEGTELRRYVGRFGWPDGFGARKHWPYRVWCDEVARQLRRRRPGHAEPDLPLFDREGGAS
jgi:hypothetical protein